MSRWERIIIHHTATGGMTPARQIRRFHMEDKKPPWSDVGYHWLIERRPQGASTEFVAVMGRPMYRTGSHCRGRNSTSIGVALIGTFTLAPPQPRMIELTAELCAGLCVANSIPSREIYGHREFGQTICPGRVPISTIRAMVTELRKGSWPRAQNHPNWRGDWLYDR